MHGLQALDQTKSCPVKFAIGHPTHDAPAALARQAAARQAFAQPYEPAGNSHSSSDQLAAALVLNYTPAWAARHSLRFMLSFMTRSRATRATRWNQVALDKPYVEFERLRSQLRTTLSRLERNPKSNY